MPQVILALRWGYSDGATIKVVAQSLVSDNVIITLNGSVTTLSNMTGLGSDSGTAKTEAFFTDSADVAGIAGFGYYTYSATQGNETVTGGFWAAPSVNDDFVIFAGTCDAIVSTNANATYSGMYTNIRAYTNQANALPVVGLMHPDDHYGYMPTNAVDDSSGTGHQITSGNAKASDSAKTYDYALGAGAALGLYSVNGNNYVIAGHNDDRIWAMQNLPVLPQKGDWDSGENDMAWLLSKTDATGTPSPQDKYDNSLLVWDALLKPLQPPAIDGVNSNAWGFQLGCLYVCAPDAITNGSGDGTATTAPTTIYGSTQITSILSALNNSSEFKTLLLANGIRYLTGTPTANASGAQYPLTLHTTEWGLLMTNAGALMANNNTNGVTGGLFTLHGDYHGLKAQVNKNTDGTNDEWFWSFNLGTLTGSANFFQIDAGVTFNGTTIEYSEGAANIGAPIENRYWCARLEVYGSRFPKEIHVVLMDTNGDDVFTRKIVHRRTGNDFVDVSLDTSDKGAQIAGEVDGL